MNLVMFMTLIMRGKLLLVLLVVMKMIDVIRKKPQDFLLMELILGSIMLKFMIMVLMMEWGLIYLCLLV